MSTAAPTRAQKHPTPATHPAGDNAFVALGVPPVLADVLAGLDITVPTPIQAATLPDSLAGRDVLGRGRTGSGKTYGFLLPMLARLAASGTRRTPQRPRALILAPTRELVGQIVASLTPLAKPLGLSAVTVFGGVGQNPQVEAFRRGVDIVVACPGRLEDLVSQGHVSLDAIEITVLDEADHMADLGFLPGVRRLMDRTPKEGQRLLFSATLDAGVDVLVKRFLHNPVTHHADSAQSPVGTMAHHVLHVSAAGHLPVLVDLTAAPGRTVVFARTKHRAKKFTRQLIANGVPAVELHGNLGQNARTRNLDDFHAGVVETLVATDIAARGIHVDDVALVIHADPPVEHKAYLHRSGRTARAGAAGTVITLMTDEQQGDVRDLTRKAGIRPTVTRVEPGHSILQQLAPGERSVVRPTTSQQIAAQEISTQVRRGDDGPRGRREGSGGSRSGGSRSSGSRSRGAGNKQAEASRPRRTGEQRGLAGDAAGQTRTSATGRQGSRRGSGGQNGQGRGLGSDQGATQGSGRAGSGQRSAGTTGSGSRTVYSSSTTGGAAGISQRSRIGSRGGR